MGLTRIAQGMVNSLWNLTQGRHFQAAQYSPQHPKKGDASSPDAVMTRSGPRLREYARWQEENDGLTVGLLDDLCDNVIGTGLMPEPGVRLRDGRLAVDFNREIVELWREFWQRPEVTGELSGPEAERLAFRTYMRDGEVFTVQHTGGGAPFPTPADYVVELLEPDYCPFDLWHHRDNVVHGVELNGWRRPVAYHFLRQHPGDLFGTINSTDTVRTAADFVLHPKFTRRIGQVRGQSVLHAVLRRLDDVRDYEESERIAARVAAAFTAYIKRPFAIGASRVSGRDNRSFKMSPGMVFDGLAAGEEVGVIDSKRPNTNLGQFRNDQLRAVVAGAGAKFSRVARNYAEANYSSLRQETVEGAVGYRRSRNYFAAIWHTPIQRGHYIASVLSGRLRVPDNVDVSTLFRVDWRGPGLPWVDQLKEVQAYREAVAAGFMSRRQVQRLLGFDPYITDAELEADDFEPIANPTPEALPNDPQAIA